MRLTKIYRIVLLSLVCVLSMILLLDLPAFSIGKQSEKAGPDTVKSIEEGVITNIAKEDLKKRLQQHLNIEEKKDVNIEDDLLSMENSFVAFAEDKTIDLTLRDVDVASILRIIAKEGEMNIVIDESVMGFITAELKNISMNEAMQTILTSEELEARVSNNTIFVASRPVMGKRGLNRRFIKTFKLSNSNAVYIADILKASIFNKGYTVSEDADGMALQAVPAVPGMPAGSSTGKTSLIGSKTIKGKVESLVSGDKFGNAGGLASEIQIQHYTAKTANIQVDNNDGGAIVIPDTRTNSLLVAGLKRDILLAKEAISYLDKPLKQVTIEVSLIELKIEDSKDLGLVTAMEGGRMAGGFNTPNGFTGYDFTSDVANQAGIVLNTISSNTSELAVRLNALVYSEEAKLLANPTIMALDGSESLIKITDQVLSKVETTVTTTGTSYSAELSDVGIVLNILPKIGNDDYVTMRIRPSITSALPKVEVGATQVGTAAIQITPISTREVILQDVRVKSGETLSIAGLTKENDVEKEAKFPILGDLPIIGKLFSNKEFDHEKTELIILIKPTIVEDIAYSSI